MRGEEATRGRLRRRRGQSGTANENEADEDVGDGGDEIREDQDADDDKNGSEEAYEDVRNDGVEGMKTKMTTTMKTGVRRQMKVSEIMALREWKTNRSTTRKWGDDVVHEDVGSDVDEGSEDRDADGDKHGGRDDVVDAHENEHVEQDLPNEIPVVDVGLSNFGDAKVVVHEKANDMVVIHLATMSP